MRALRQLAIDGLDIHMEGPFGNSLLRNAATQDSAAALIALLDLGANPNHRTSYCSPVDKRSEAGFTPLMYAHTVEAVHALIAYGANVNLASDAGITPLMRAPTEEVARLLVYNGADVEAVNPAGSSALMYAVQMDRVGVVAYLLSIGANPNIRQNCRRGKKTYTPLRLAREGIATWSRFPSDEFAKNRLAAANRIADLLMAAGATV